ncbi:EthD domain-containing protein [Psychromonas aquimarina]|uniref:EthD domain-containing protein n=1 Tax=Psychromonas aquimarina TaxID=444919 RepID=UPI00048B0F44|nr:EthD domain-containing protein [Psychromonas aquimarina]
MIKFIMCCTRHAEMTREEFQDYWLNSHGPLFQKFADTYRAKKYIQSHTIATPLNEGIRESRGMMQAYDGVAEVWFESEQELMEAMSSSEGQEISAVLLKDEGNFIDHAKSTAFIAKEYEL